MPLIQQMLILSVILFFTNISEVYGNIVKINLTECKNIAGERCTYKLKGTEIESKGPDADLYTRYFEVPEEDRKYL